MKLFDFLAKVSEFAYVARSVRTGGREKRFSHFFTNLAQVDLLRRSSQASERSLCHPSAMMFLEPAVSKDVWIALMLLMLLRGLRFGQICMVILLMSFEPVMYRNH